MTDDELHAVWTAFDPTMSRRRRIDARVSAWLEAHETWIAAEWLGLFTVAPFATLGLVTVSALAIALTPLAWLATTISTSTLGVSCSSS